MYIASIDPKTKLLFSEEQSTTVEALCNYIKDSFQLNLARLKSEHNNSIQGARLAVRYCGIDITYLDVKLNEQSRILFDIRDDSEIALTSHQGLSSLLNSGNDRYDENYSQRIDTADWKGWSPMELQRYFSPSVVDVYCIDNISTLGVSNFLSELISKKGETFPVLALYACNMLNPIGKIGVHSVPNLYRAKQGELIHTLTEIIICHDNGGSLLSEKQFKRAKFNRTEKLRHLKKSAVTRHLL